MILFILGLILGALLKELLVKLYKTAIEWSKEL